MKSMANRRPPEQLLLVIVLKTMIIHLTATSSLVSNTLLRFKETTIHSSGELEDWIAGTNHCNWTGIICDEGGGVVGLKLDSMGLSGSFNIDELEGLINLQMLSVKYNKFNGRIADDAFVGMGKLRTVDLSMNRFWGPIPTSVAGLQGLVELRLDGNEFDGELPELKQPGLQVLNVSDNNLHGEIPESLARISATMFAGNKNLCGPPLSVACKTSEKFATQLIPIVVIILAVALAFAGIIANGRLPRRGHDKHHLIEKPSPSAPKPPHGTTFNSTATTLAHAPIYNHANKVAGAAAAADREQNQGRLVFVKEGGKRFEMQDLLKASAEVLPGGSSRSSFKAVLEGGYAVVVKRFKEMKRLGKEEFQEYMKKVGKLSHPNLLPLVAYYCRKEDKLLVTDYVPNGSLANLLHGNRKTMLDWPTRLKIVKGIARGLAYLYQEMPMLTVPHGHLKSSNVLLNRSLEPLLTEYALEPAINKAHASGILAACKSPEFVQFGQTSKKSDVWSLGILVLELLTGKFPGNNGGKAGGEEVDLVKWVNAVVREEWTGEVFDREMRGATNSEEDMLKLLKIGLRCCERRVEKRWGMEEALKKIEELRERVEENNDHEDYSSFYSEVGDGHYSSRVMAKDGGFSFSAKT